MTEGIGHNNGPAMDAGRTFRVHQWRRAKANMAAARLNPATVRRHQQISPAQDFEFE